MEETDTCLALASHGHLPSGCRNGSENGRARSQCRGTLDSPVPDHSHTTRRGAKDATKLAGTSHCSRVTTLGHHPLSRRAEAGEQNRSLQRLRHDGLLTSSCFPNLSRADTCSSARRILEVPVVRVPDRMKSCSTKAVDHEAPLCPMSDLPTLL